MPLDASAFDKIKTFADYQRADQEFQLKKQLAEQNMLKMQQGGDLPAALQIADAYAKARASGDTQRMRDIALAAKSFDHGVTIDAGGIAQPIQGYGQAVGSIEGAKSGYKEQAQKDVQAVMNPIIAGGEAGARLQQEQTYKPVIAGAEQDAKNASDRRANIEKKVTQGKESGSVIDELLTPDESGRTVLDKATGSGVGALYAGGKSLFGVSDESTQANAQLAIYGGRLLNNVPRMEGPQSDKDMATYKEQAGKIADPKIPAPDKKAALFAIKQLNEKYADIAPSLYKKGEAEFNAKKATSAIPQAAIEHLMKERSDPAALAEFDQTFGQGAAARILNGK
jgi:hypothetical protein